MTLPELSIRRHVLAYMLSAVFVLFGLIAYKDIGVDRYPQVEFPVVSITTTLRGANPDIVDASITSILESRLNSIPGIDIISSNSSPGVSLIMIQFILDKDIDVGFNEVQAKVNQALRLLPSDADPPVVAKVEVGASPIMWLSLQGDRTLQQLNQYAQNVVKKRLETIDGVGEVRIGGRRERTIRVNLDLDRMASFGVTAQDLRQAFAGQHLQLPGGFLVGKEREDLIKLDFEFHSARALEELIVRHRDGAPLRLRDIATVEDGLDDFRQIARFNGKPAVGVGIVKVSGSNTVAIIDAVLDRVDREIRPQLPPGMTISVASNDADFIRNIIRSLTDHLVEGTLLAGLVVWFFLKNFRPTLIVATAIPVSLLGAVALMYFLGYTFNTMTLLGLLLLIGVVVDDAIVVLENIHRHREHIDPDPVSAAVNGSRQVVFAVVASTLTLVSIFASVLFLGGMIGRFFESFAVVVTSGVLISLFVSLTLTPMLCARHLKVGEKHGRIYRAVERFLTGMENGYRHLLVIALSHRWKVVAVTLLIVLSSGFFFAKTAKEFVPQEDEGRFIVFFRAPLGTNIESTDRYLHDIEGILASHEEIATFFTAIGLGDAGQVNKGIAFVRLVPKSERDIRQQDLLPILRRELAGIPGVFAVAASPSPVGGQRGEPLQFVLTGPDLGEVARLSQELLARLSADDEMGRIDLDLQMDLPQVRIDVDRPLAAELGLSAADVGAAINLLAGGENIAKYNDDPGDGERYNIRLKAADGELSTAGDLTRIYVRSRTGEMIRLDTVARAERILGPAVITRFSLQYSGAFYVTPNIPLGLAVEKLHAEAADLLPLGYRVELMGQAREFSSTQKYAAFAFFLATVLVYMVLASQFNSFIQPFIIMTAQPLAIIGGVFALWITGHSLNIFSMIGMVLLIGLVAKNSILLVDLSNQMRAEGKAVDDSLREACPIRLRPVLMTSLTVILALLPPAIGLGAGADTNGPLAVAVIGGMLSSTALTLVVVPVAYSLIENFHERRRLKRAG